MATRKPAAKKVPAKKTVKRKAVAKKAVTRKSQITGKAPTKRLVKRRRANTTPGYFPNPAEVLKAHAPPKYYVAMIPTYSTQEAARKAGLAMSEKYGCALRIISD